MPDPGTIHIVQLSEAGHHFYRLSRAIRNGERVALVDGRSGDLIGSIVPTGMAPVTAEELDHAALDQAMNARRSRAARERMVERMASA
jgi:hypothetical protein